jgi:hypothetical protein
VVVAKRVGAGLVAAVSVALAAIVVVGMASGLDRDFDKGRVELAQYLPVMVGGAFTLALLGACCFLSVRTAREGQWPPIVPLALAVLAFLFWALARVAEYSS